MGGFENERVRTGKAMDTLQFLSQASEARRLYETRQKYMHDEASMIDRAKSIEIAKAKKT
ncbi:hypothetical protein [Paenibacillus polymyxa]|uniref:hypothetical protein n=1 Tax=Paenibacillus polymyxa TaxID=1406 RepID=UPI0002F80203|nr:hypothetical protein [Paenibacillus polymyxa]